MININEDDYIAVPVVVGDKPIIPHDHSIIVSSNVSFEQLVDAIAYEPKCDIISFFITDSRAFRVLCPIRHTEPDRLFWHNGWLLSSSFAKIGKGELADISKFPIRLNKAETFKGASKGKRKNSRPKNIEVLSDRMQKAVVDAKKAKRK